ncbi:hypothetical protein SAMN05216553_117133 [Lentzea fradiae]|uniref:DUF6879 domain-containing protein n=1 Tax=Lentzea fradiae TaxID=200378 RepID=A0A1G8ADL1_9PSEU|nr:DUF6879 family protein [Lentzea fradiae]SDH19052.1 hypothetical protein SAMN05216553_117133 [Lentzea fradiae]
MVPIILNNEQFGRLFVDFRKSATRIETLPVYTVEEEREPIEHYRSGRPLPAGRNEEWAANIRRSVAAGKYMGRVHIIDHELTPYLRFEIDWYYRVNSAAGEDIRFIYREDVPDLYYTDTWLFDEAVVVDLSYTPEGELLYINRNDHPERLWHARRAWREFHARSFPLEQLLAELPGRPCESGNRSWTTKPFARNS